MHLSGALKGRAKRETCLTLLLPFPHHHLTSQERLYALQYGAQYDTSPPQDLWHQPKSVAPPVPVKTIAWGPSEPSLGATPPSRKRTESAALKTGDKLPPKELPVWRLDFFQLRSYSPARDGPQLGGHPRLRAGGAPRLVDVDLQHPPSAIPTQLGRIDVGADGTGDGLWPWRRDGRELAAVPPLDQLGRAHPRTPANDRKQSHDGFLRCAEGRVHVRGALSPYKASKSRSSSSSPSQAPRGPWKCRTSSACAPPAPPSSAQGNRQRTLGVLGHGFVGAGVAGVVTVVRAGGVGRVVRVVGGERVWRRFGGSGRRRNGKELLPMARTGGRSK
ncbi:hypothetical protein B0H14DRAFT_2596048 [Mycena olivaceomarginata]|nr:hypothetical protein B0H14DRAFT_2596048 [Mycena olivaceomarginata]